jgi:hypothetical protein
MTVRVVLAAVATSAILAGCTSALDVRYHEAGANRGLLASVAPRRVIVGPIADRRMDQTRIGAAPKNGDAITTTRTVADAVREALVVELTKNGHAIVSDGGDIRLVADVEEFWLDTAGRDGTTHYVGRVALAVAVRDERTGATLFMRRYAGIRRRAAEPDAREAWREVMDAALARTLRDIATDAEFVAALAGAQSMSRTGKTTSSKRRARIPRAAHAAWSIARACDTSAAKTSSSRRASARSKITTFSS